MQIVCTVNDGDLPVEITWFLNEKPITDLFDISTSPLGRRSSALTIESVQYEHVGNFTCKAHNKAGKTEYSAPLQVNGYYNFSYLFLFISLRHFLIPGIHLFLFKLTNSFRNKITMHTCDEKYPLNHLSNPITVNCFFDIYSL